MQLKRARIKKTGEANRQNNEKLVLLRQDWFPLQVDDIATRVKITSACTP